MRLLYIAPRYHTNQVPIMRGLKRMGHEVCFLSQYEGKVEDHTDVKPIIVGYSRLFQFIYSIYMKTVGKNDAQAGDRKLKCGFPPFGKMKHQIEMFQPDVVILRERSVYSIVAYRICRKWKIPAILYNQSPLWEERIKNDLPHRLIRVITPPVRMTPVYGTPGEGKVIEPGAAFVPFVMEAVCEPNDREWFPDGVTRILAIGKYEERKNHRMLIEAAEQLSKQYSLHLTIAGECTASHHCEYYETLTDYIENHHLQELVTLRMNLSREEVQQQYLKSDLFVIPSTREPASISQLEAMACSLPVICGDANGTACYVEDNKNGLLFQDNNVDSLKSKLSQMLSDPKRMMKMGAESYWLVKEKYQIGNYWTNIERILGGM